MRVYVVGSISKENILSKPIEQLKWFGLGFLMDITNDLRTLFGMPRRCRRELFRREEMILRLMSRNRKQKPMDEFKRFLFLISLVAIFYLLHVWYNRPRA